MEKEYHRIPVVEYGGKNPEEKETRQDIDIKLREKPSVRYNVPNRNIITP